MSLLKTKPRWCESHATNAGWVNSISGELLVSMRGLKDRLDAESDPEVVEAPVVKQVVEQTVKKPKRSQKIIAEVVEYQVGTDSEIIGE